MMTPNGAIPLIVYPRKNISEVRSCVLANYGHIKYELPFINALCVEVPTQKVNYIKNHRRVALVAEDAEVSKLEPGIQASFDPALSAFKITGKDILKKAALNPADEMSGGSLTGEGEGIGIAVIDTGLAPHYDMVKPYNRIAAFHDFLNGKTLPYDDDGHGTHVAGIAAGNGYACGRLYEGSAPKANVIALKALNQVGSGVISDILAAMQWALDNKRKYNIRVVNLSLGLAVFGEPKESLQDPLVLGANALVGGGISVITAAGNSGPEPCTITSPGISPYVITVGSAGIAGTFPFIPGFSSRGPTPLGLHKPDLVAPGVDIISLDASTGKTYMRQTGTSMSAPAIAGIAACIYSKYPKLTPKQIKQIIISLAVPILGESQDAQGHGYLEI